MHDSFTFLDPPPVPPHHRITASFSSHFGKIIRCVPHTYLASRQGTPVWIEPGDTTKELPPCETRRERERHYGVMCTLNVRHHQGVSRRDERPACRKALRVLSVVLQHLRIRTVRGLDSEGMRTVWGSMCPLLVIFVTAFTE